MYSLCIHSFFQQIFVTIAELWKQPKCPLIDEWIKKLWYVHTVEYDSVIKMNEILPFVTIWMDLESIMISEINQRKTNTVCLSYTWNLKINNTKLPFVDTETDLWLSEVGGKEWEK